VGNKITRKETFSSLICQPHMPHGLLWKRNLVSVLRIRLKAA